MNDGTTGEDVPSIEPTPPDLGSEVPGSELDAYLDGRLDEWGLAAMESRFDSDPALVRERETARSIDVAIGRLFAPPVLAQLESEVSHRSAGAALGNDPTRLARRGRSWSARWALLVAGSMAAAAAIVIGVLTVAPQRWLQSAPAGRGETMPSTPEAVYARLVAGGFQPYWACADDAEFREFTAAEYATPFLFASAPSVEVLGWAYQTEVLGRRPGIILARVDGSPVVVLVDRTEHDRPMALSPESGLALHRRELSGIVLYEITPTSEPSVIPFAFEAGNP